MYNIFETSIPFQERLHQVGQFLPHLVYKNFQRMRLGFMYK